MMSFPGGVFAPLSQIGSIGATGLLLLHITNCALVLAAGRALAGALGAAGRRADVCAAVAAALFGLHPLRAAALDATSRPALQSCAFALAAFALYLKAHSGAGWRRAWLAGSAASAALAAASWSVAAAALLPFLLAVDVWAFGRIGGSGWTRPGPAQAWLEKLPFTLLAYAGCVYALAGHYLYGPPRVPHWALGFDARRAAGGLALWARQLLAPSATPLIEPAWDSAALALTGIAAWLALARLAQRARAGAGLWPLGCATAFVVHELAAWAPERLQAQFDLPRASYGAAAFLAVGVAAFAAGRLGRARPIWIRRAAVAAGLLLAAEAWATGREALALRDPRAALQRQAAADPSCFDCRLQLGSISAAAETLMTLATDRRIDAEDAVTIERIANGLALAGNRDAAPLFKVVIALDPGRAGSHFNLALLDFQAGRIGEAIQEARAAVQRDPLWANARTNLGYFLQARGDYAAAIEQYQEALRLDPGSTLTRNNMLAAQARLKAR